MNNNNILYRFFPICIKIIVIIVVDDYIIL